MKRDEVDYKQLWENRHRRLAYTFMACWFLFGILSAWLMKSHFYLVIGVWLIAVPWLLPYSWKTLQKAVP